MRPTLGYTGSRTLLEQRSNQALLQAAFPSGRPPKQLRGRGRMPRLVTLPWRQVKEQVTVEVVTLEDKRLHHIVRPELELQQPHKSYARKHIEKKASPRHRSTERVCQPALRP